MIERLLAPLAAALILAAVASAQEVRLSVETGRGLLVTDHGVNPLTRGRRVPPIQGPGHFELAPGARANLSWAGRCSVELRGPASVAWQPSTGSHGLRLDFGALREVDVEVRSGSVRVGLPGAWRAQLNEGAFSFYGLPAGGVELVHRAGRDVRATWVGGEGFAPPPIPIHAGDRARLQGEPSFPVRGDASASAPEWGASTWPWGEGGIPDQPDLAVRNAPGWSTGTDWPWPVEEEDLEPWQRWDWPWRSPHAHKETEHDAQAPEGQLPYEATPPIEVTGPWGGYAWPWETSATALPEDHPDRDPVTSVTQDAPTDDSSAAQTDSADGGTEAADAGATEVGVDSSTHGAQREAEASGTSAGADKPLALVGDDAERAVVVEEAPSALDEVDSGRTDRSHGWDTPGDDPLPPPSAFVAEHWRGLPEAGIEFHVSYAIQIGPPYEVRTLKDGGRELLLPSTSSEPLWYFSPNLDLRIFPGASLVLEKNGSIRYHRGTVRVLTADPARRF